MPFIDEDELTDGELQTVALEEKGGEGEAALENNERGGVVSFVQSAFNRSVDMKRSDEYRWLEAYKNYRGVYDSSLAFTSSEKSKAFVKITKTKVQASAAMIVDILFSGNKFPVGVEASKIPEGVAEKVHFDPQQTQGEGGGESEIDATTARPNIKALTASLREKLKPVMDDLKLGSGPTPKTHTFEPAKESARNMEKMIHDQLDEAGVDAQLSSTVFELSLFGTGIFKGPFVVDKEYPKWNEEGKYEPVFHPVPDFEHVSIWDIYPDADARNKDECEWMIQRHRFSRSKLRKLKKRPNFRHESIELAIKDGPNYIPQWWESDLNDNTLNDIKDRWEVLEYWGTIDRELAIEAGLDLDEHFDDNVDEVQLNAWICNGQLLRLVLNPFEPVRIPYFIVPYELNPYSIFGVGVAENMADTQLAMNGFFRLAIDNAVLSSNVIFEIDETNMVPGQDLEIYPGKVFRRQSGAPGQALFGTKIPNVTSECIQMFDKARQLSDESTGIPSYSHGGTGVQNVGRTASGMSMLMGAADRNIKAVVRNIDDYLLAPLGKSCFAFNMQFNFDNIDIVGDLEVLARGTESLMKNEVRSQKLLQFLQITANPLDAPFTNRAYALKELAASLDLDEDEMVHNPAAAAVQMELYKSMGIDPAGQAGQQEGSMAPGTPPGPQGGAPTGAPGQAVPSEIAGPGEAANTDPTQSPNAEGASL